LPPPNTTSPNGIILDIASRAIIKVSRARQRCQKWNQVLPLPLQKDLRLLKIFIARIVISVFHEADAIFDRRATSIAMVNGSRSYRCRRRFCKRPRRRADPCM
jgi:hypothetical protein